MTTLDAPRSDAIHFNVEGYKKIGVRFAEAARELIYGEPLDASLRLLEARLVGNGRRIELVYDGAVTGGGASLFRVLDGMLPVPVSQATSSGNVVTLELGIRASGAATVSYGYARVATSPWVKDLRGTPVPAFEKVPISSFSAR